MINKNSISLANAGLVQDCSNSIANPLELLQSCAKCRYVHSCNHVKSILGFVTEFTVMFVVLANGGIAFIWKLCCHWLKSLHQFHVTLTHWGQVTYICVGKQTIIGSDKGLPPGRRQAIIWTNAGILLIGPLGTNFSEISIKILTFSFTKMHLKVSSAKWRPFCLGLNVLMSEC